MRRGDLRSSMRIIRWTRRSTPPRSRWIASSRTLERSGTARVRRRPMVPTVSARRRSVATGSSARSARGDSAGSTWRTTTTSTAPWRSRCPTPSGSPAPRTSRPTWPRPAPSPGSTTRTSSRSTTWAGPTTGSATSSPSTSRGSDLAERMRRGRPTFRESAELVAAVAEALHHAHTRGLVHRDVKPANILHRRRGQAVRRRLRAGAAGRGLRQGARDRRHARLHEPRAGPGRGPPGRRPLGHLQPGRRLLRAADRPPAVPGRVARGAAASRSLPDRAPAAPPDRRHDPQGAGADLPEGAGEAGVGAVQHGPRPGRRPAALPPGRGGVRVARDRPRHGRLRRPARPRRPTPTPPTPARPDSERAGRQDRPQGAALVRRSTTPTSSSSCSPAPATATACPRASGSGRPGSSRPTPTPPSGSG